MIVTKKVNQHIYVRAILCLSCCLYTQGRFRQNFFNNFLFQIITKGCKNDRRGIVPLLPPVSVEKLIRKKGQKQVKKKAFKT